MSTDAAATGGEGAPAEVRPLLRVVRGSPTAAELAALVAVVAAAAAAGGPDDAGEPEVRPRHGSWADPAARLRRGVVVGPGAWQASARAGW